MNIPLGKYTSIDDISGWRREENGQFIFQITKSSSFCFLAEPFALAALVEMRRSKCQIKVTFNVPYEDAEDQLMDKLPVLTSIFGLQLIYAAEIIEDASRNDVTKALRKSLWERVTSKEGCIGDGSFTILVSREPDVPIPLCLLDGHSNALPSQTRFRTVLDSFSGSMGIKDLFQIGSLFEKVSPEAEISRFLFEAFRNSCEHANEGATTTAPPIGVWGISVEKFIFNSVDEVKGRHGLPDVVKSYLNAIWSAQRAKDFRAIGFTVMDSGPGIQHTLSQSIHVNRWLRLNAAFRPGVSRKPPSGGINRGEGLPNVAEAAAKLRALLIVRSSELCGLRNFYRTPTIHHKSGLLNRWYAKGHPGQGTALTVLWPVS